MKGKLYGKGINDSGYTVKKYESVQLSKGVQKQKLIWFCPYYDKWKGMLRRCLSDEYKSKHPTYTNCSVDDRWLLFSNFKDWCLEYEKFYDVNVKNTDLDKDLILEGNNIYSPETCCLIDNSINKFLTDNKARRGSLPIGVSFRKLKGVTIGLRSRCKNPFTLKEVSCGLYPLGCEKEAHEAWRKQKHEFSILLSESDFIKDSRVSDALRKRYSFENWY